MKMKNCFNNLREYYKTICVNCIEFPVYSLVRYREIFEEFILCNWADIHFRGILNNIA